MARCVVMAMGAVVFATGLVAAPVDVSRAEAADGPPQKVIVLLRDQHPDLSPRSATAQRADAVARDQSPVLDSLRAGGATDLQSLSLVNAVAATATPSELTKVSADPRVAAVVPDLPVRRSPVGELVRADSPREGSSSCPAAPGQPMLEPEALGLTHTDVAQRSASGKGVKIAFFAEGIDQDNPEFVRPDGSRVISKVVDFSGDGLADHSGGSEAFGDASAIAAQGSRGYDLATELPGSKAPKGCSFRIRGFAPDAELVGVKIYGENGGGTTSAIVRGIQYAVEHERVDVLSQSFGSNLYPDAATDPVRLADRVAVAAGVTVVAASGDAGPSGTVASPASDPQVIAVGATTSLRLYAQAYGYQGWVNDNLAAFSSGGTTLGGRLVDLVAPGMMGMAACTPDPRWADCTHQTQVMGGTSQSAPFVAATAALVIETYKRAHGDERPSPDLVKRIITGTAADLGVSADQQGAGLLDSDAAVRAAAAYEVRGATVSAALVPSAGQLDLSGEPAGLRYATVALTNTGPRPQQVTMTSRAVGRQTFGTDRTITIGEPKDTGLSEGAAAADPVTVSVPPGTPLLDATMVWPGTADSGKLSLVLIDPAGRLAQLSYDSGKGGYSNHQNATVRAPMPGTWTIKPVWSTGILKRSPASKPGSYRGQARLRVAGFGYAQTGVATQTKRVPAGGSVPFSVRIPLPSQAGDAPMSLQFDSDAGTHLSLPVARQVLIPADPRRTGEFTATVTGGVGWPGIGQTLGYHLDVPAGHHSVTLDLTSPDPETGLTYYLVSPDGYILARDTNRTGEGGKVKTPEATLTANDPEPGRWTLIIGMVDGVSGKDISQRISGRVRLDAVSATTQGLPDDPGEIIKRGATITASVQVPNVAAVRRALFLDARLDSYTDVDIRPEGEAKPSVTVPGSLSWWVPSHTTALRASATADVPVDLSLAPWTRAPEVFSRHPGTRPEIAARAGQLTSGDWSSSVARPGPFDGAQQKGATATLSLIAHTQAFDPAVSEQTGKYWDVSASYDPVWVEPGETATMTVTISPTAPVGTVVRGTLYVGSDTIAYGSFGSELIGLPYTYTVG